VWAVVEYLGDRVRRGVEGSEERSRARNEGMCPRLWFPFEASAMFVCMRRLYVYVCVASIRIACFIRCSVG
jgi:hypothetical protein